MPLTLRQLIDYAEQSLAGQMDGRIDPSDVVNQAGRHLVSMHNWVSFQRAVAPLSFVQDQNYVELPEDFARLVDIEATDSITKDVFLTTLQEVERLRQDLVTNLFDHFVALESPAQQDTNHPAPQPRLAIWPTPSDSQNNAMRLIYEAGWRELSQQDQYANVPTFMDTLLIELTRIFARGFQDDARGTASVYQRLEDLEKSQFFRTVKERDGTQQYSYGQLQGGAVQGQKHTIPYRPYRVIGRN